MTSTCSVTDGLRMAPVEPHTGGRRLPPKPGATVMVRVSQEVWRELERTRAMHGYRFAAIIDQWMLTAVGRGGEQ